MRIRYRVLQTPSKGAGAFMPVPAAQRQAASAGQNQAGIVGSPGTTPVPSPRPESMNDQSFGGRYNQPSDCAPNVFYPSIYYWRPNHSVHFPGKLLCDHVLPVPAQPMGAVPKQWQHRVRVGGRTTTAAIRPFTQWPTYGGR
jgi:hypothetical protein